MQTPPAPPSAAAPNQGRHFFILLVKVGAGVLMLIVIILAGLFGYIAYERGKYARLTDTHDLKHRLESMGAEYIGSRPNGALVIGVLQNGRRLVSGFGTTGPGAKTSPNGQTMFEIGSITKVFTALCLVTMVQGDRVKLEDRIGQLLPSDVHLPQELEPITLRQLATHTSGLPRLPDNFDLSPTNLANPYATYRPADLYRYLSKARLDRPPGTGSEYSNLGFGLLGHLLELKSGTNYETLVRQMVCQPLELTNTVIHLSETQKARLAPGHDVKGNVVSNWDMDVLAPAGALRSCADDLMKFVEANLAAPSGSPIGKALDRAQKKEMELGISNLALGWQMTKSLQGGLDLLWHNGGTGGYVSFIGFDREHQTGVVILSDVGDALAGRSDVDRYGMEILKLASKVSIF